MSKKFGYSMFLAILFVILGLSIPVVFSEDGAPPGDNRISPKFNDGPSIIWQAPFREKGLTIIPGSVRAKFGRFELRWIIDGAGRARLVTVDPVGAGDMPPLEKKIFIWVRDNGTTLLFQEWFPLVNENKPATIRKIASVATKDLFSVLPENSFPPGSSLNQMIQTIHWDSKYQKKGVQYLPGKLSTTWGRQNIYWKKKAGGIPELFSSGTRGNKERLNFESRLFLWMDGALDTTGIFQEKQLKLRRGDIFYLWPLAVVPTTQLRAGFKEIN